MNIEISLDEVEANLVQTAASLWSIETLHEYTKAAAIAAAELIIIRRIDALRPLADSLPDAKGSLEILTGQLEQIYSIGLPSLSIEDSPTDVEELISILKDVLSDLQAFLRRHQS